MRRLAAVIGAAALVVVAFVVRGAIDGDDGDDGNGSNGSAPGATVPADSDPPSPAASLVCVTELRAACADLAEAHPGLAVTVEDAGATLDRLAGWADPATAPLWLTVDPFPAMVDAVRGSAPLGFESVAVGASPLAVAVPADGRSSVLAAACAGAALWPCLGDRAGDPWTDLGGEADWATVRPALGDVTGSALGLASFAGAVAGFAGSPTFDSTDWSAHVPALRALARASSRAPNSGGTPLATMATGRAVDAAASAGFELTGLGAGGGRFTLVYPDPDMWMEAVLAAPRGVAFPAGLADDAAAALASAGWQDPPPGGPGLPPAAVMIDLRALWGELT